MFGDGIAKASNTDFEFDFAGEKDIINFLVGMGNRIKDGTLTKADIEDIKKSEIFTKPTKKETPRAVSFSKSIYDDKTLFTPEDLVQIIKAPSSKPSEIDGAEKALTNQFDLLALKALNYDTRKGDIARENVVSAAREYLHGIINVPILHSHQKICYWLFPIFDTIIILFLNFKPIVNRRFFKMTRTR